MRQYIAIIIGALVACMVLLLVGMIANSIQPTPPELMDSSSPEAVARRVEAASLFVWMTTIFGLMLGALIGGYVGVRVDQEHQTRITRGVGLLLSFWAFYTFYIVYPNVLWVPVIMLLSVFIFSHYGGVIAGKRS